MEAFAEPVHVAIKLRPLSLDPNDDMVLDIALNSDADALVTGNKKHFNATGIRFGIPILSPLELITNMRKEPRHGHRRS